VTRGGRRSDEADMTSTTNTDRVDATVAAHAESAHGHHAPAAAPTAHAHGQQHPLKLYFTVWILLFVLSAGSYAVDYFNFHGYLRWTLIIAFMLLKAGLIVAVFMHMAWERLALVYAILLPPLAVLVFMGIMALEGYYTNFSRLVFFASGS
jgi:cytochrome c oxidase subunit 4